MLNNTEITQRQVRKLLARPGFKTLSLPMLERYIKEGSLPKPTVRNGFRYFKLADVENLLYRINRPTPAAEPKKYPSGTRKCFVNAGLG